MFFEYNEYDYVVHHLDDDGRYHCEDGPALINRNGCKIWFRHGMLHREGGPAIEYTDGTKKWFFDGKYHRENGPAIENANGDKSWFRHGRLHRDDGPAVFRANGEKRWYVDGRAHRIGGPAVEYPSGVYRWFFYGRRVSKEEYNELCSNPPQPIAPSIIKTPFQKLIALFIAHPELIEKSVDVAAEVENQIQHQI